MNLFTFSLAPFVFGIDGAQVVRVAERADASETLTRTLDLLTLFRLSGETSSVRSERHRMRKMVIVAHDRNFWGIIVGNLLTMASFSEKQLFSFDEFVTGITAQCGIVAAFRTSEMGQFGFLLDLNQLIAKHNRP